jgi:hypothetical protein
MRTLFSFHDRYRILHLTWFAFFLSFVVWFSFAPFAAIIQRELHLTAAQLKILGICNLALTIPVRLVFGIVRPRYRSSSTFSGLLMFAIFPCLLLATAQTFNQMVWSMLLNSILGAGFALGIRLVAQCPPKEISLPQSIYGGSRNFSAAAAKSYLPILIVVSAYLIGGALNWRIAIALVGFVTTVYGSIYFRYTQDIFPGKVYQGLMGQDGWEVNSQHWVLTRLDLGRLLWLRWLKKARLRWKSYWFKTLGRWRSCPLIRPVEPASRRHVLWSWFGSFLAIAIASYLSVKTNTPLLMAPFGATSVLLFAVPDSPLAQPRNVICGNLLSAVVSLMILHLLGSSPLTIGMAVSTAIGLMQLTETVHPPGGAIALVVMMTRPNWQFILTPTLEGSLIFVLCAVIFNNLAQERTYPKHWL